MRLAVKLYTTYPIRCQGPAIEMANELNQAPTQPRNELNPRMNSTKERTQPGYELNLIN